MTFLTLLLAAQSRITYLTVQGKWDIIIYQVLRRTADGHPSWKKLYHLEARCERHLQKRSSGTSPTTAARIHVEREVLQGDMPLVWPFNGPVYFQPIRRGPALDFSFLPPFDSSSLFEWTLWRYSRQPRLWPSRQGKPAMPTIGWPTCQECQGTSQTSGGHTGYGLWNWNWYKKLYG